MKNPRSTTSGIEIIKSELVATTQFLFIILSNHKPFLRSYEVTKNVGLIISAVLTFNGYKQTPKQSVYINYEYVIVIIMKISDSRFQAKLNKL